MWFIFALITTLAWGAADLFYKKGADEKDKYSHLKTTMIVGLVMGLHAAGMLLFTDMNYDFRNIVVYLPVSLMYILSMTVGYFGLRYLELSISSPIQNGSGAVTALLCLFLLGQTMDTISAVAVICVCLGVFLLGVFEKSKQDEYKELNNKKYKIGFVAFLMPILYCIIDSLGTFFDAYYLDNIATTPLLNVTEATFENVANTSYELTFFICAILIFIFLSFIKKEKIEIKEQKDRTIAAVFETLGQFTYVYALSGTAVVAAPMIASYSIVSVVLSRLFLKENLEKKQYFVIALVMIGIAMLGVSEAIAS
ncbi:MAG: EamA family transporter [Clostridia bacterium]|nr:EamA family transporter [Clostridia bacterium]